MIPCYKSGGKSDPNNYRPISLLPIVSKVLESIINDKMRSHLFGLNLISNNQFGFRPKHSTLDLLMSTSQKWSDALENGQEVKVVALDICRVFDSVWHKGLLSKLMSFGVGGCLCRWIRDFLHDRFIKVVLNGCESTAGHINAGVPQGSILGPSLFLIYINDLAKVVSNDINMFADDTTLSAVVPNVKSRKITADCINTDLKEIEAWANEWLVKFNAKKTQFLHICRKTSIDASNINFCSEILNPADSIKLVGINISKNLDWSAHVESIAKTAGRSLGVFCKANKLLDSDGLATLYKTKVRSLMEYCGPVWQSASVTALKKLDVIQRKACKILGTKGDVCLKFNLDSLQHRRKVSGLCQIYRMVSGVAPNKVCELLPPYDIKMRDSRQTEQRHHFQISVKTSRTGSHMHSFIPYYVDKWNKLPVDCIYGQRGDLADLQTFKIKVNHYLRSNSAF